MSSVRPITPYSVHYKFRANSKHAQNSVPLQSKTTSSYATIPHYTYFGASERADDSKVIARTETAMAHIMKGHPAKAGDIIDNGHVDPNYFSKEHNATILTLLSDKIMLTKNTLPYESVALQIIELTSFNPNLELDLKRFGSSATKTPLFEYIAHNRQPMLLKAILSHKDFNASDKVLSEVASALSKEKDANNDLKHCTKIIRGLLRRRHNARMENEQTTTKTSIHAALKPYYVDTKSICPNGFADIGGMEEAKAIANEFMILPWSSEFRETLAENRVKMPNGFLMYGPPGCGKTFISAAIAREMGINMYEVDLSVIGSKYVYETENTLRKIFNALEASYRRTNTPSLLFLDEIDAVCASREDTNADWLRVQTSTILKLINNASDKGIILVGATNLLQNVDSAVMRTGRFDKKIEIKKPEPKEREAIFRTLAKGRPVAAKVEEMLPELVSLTDNFTCSDISAVFYQALRSAIFSRQKDVSAENFRDAIKKISASSSHSGRKIGFTID